ncbi:MAG: aspartyl protease family protein [Acidobacteriaceae bacterium]|nr:aspartyl protease family protein [Acidobacteriaceae bacterium]
MRIWVTAVFVSSAFLSSAQLFGGTNPALAAYEDADYEKAIPLLQSALAANRNDPVLTAALLSSLVYRERVEDAMEAAAADAINFPNAPEVLGARGEFAFYLGDMPEAEKLFRAAIKIKETPRACFGLSRLYRAACFYRTARWFCMKAHELDPEDAFITQRFLAYLPEPKRSELLPPFVAAHPWLYSQSERARATSVEIAQELDTRRPFEMENGGQESAIRLISITRGSGRLIGAGLELRIGARKPLRLLLDTGASGIVLREDTIDKAELNHLGSGESWGIGDKGTRKSFAAVADECQIGSLKFRACILRGMSGKARVAGDDEDGLIGTDVFSNYVITIDFLNRKLRLKPQPRRPPNPQGYDRVIPPDEADFTPVFRFGHRLLISTEVNRKTTGLFLIDTGAQSSDIDSTFARLSTKVHSDDSKRIRGVSGEVKDVFEADSAELHFAHFRQSNLGLTSFNLNNAPQHQEVRMAGILGFPTLTLFRSITIDYRNGLVYFNYR